MATTGLLNAPGNTARAVILGPAHALFVDAATFAVLVAAGIRRSDLGGPEPAPIPRPGRPGGGYRRDLRDGVKLVAATPLLLGITVLTLLAQGLDQGWSSVILPVDVRDKLHSVVVLGTAESAFAVGALTSSPAPLIAMMAVEGLACGPLNPITIDITYQLTPEHLRGRAIGTMTGTALIATPFGALAAGQLVDALGLPAATAIFGGVYLLVTLVPVVFPLYRQMSETAKPPVP